MTPRDIWILAETIDGEARGEPDEGKVAVGYSVRNRSARTGRGLGATCLLSSHYSCWNNAAWNDANQRTMLMSDLHDKAFARCMIAALQVAHGLVADPTAGATHYHANSIEPPDWAYDQRTGARLPYVAIGKHYFYCNVD